MEADWYVDPLGRYEGRFFDGEQWTDQVSEGGRRAVDPDFPPADGAGATGAVLAPTRRPARTDLPAADIVESPVRVVAVLEVPPAEGRSLRRLALFALAALAAVLLGIALVLTLGGDDEPTAEPLDLGADDAARVEDLASGGEEVFGDSPEELDVDAPEGAVPADATFGPEELVEVGSLQVLNGVSLLEGLEEWHRGFAEGRRVLLPEDAGCWFGRLGGAAVQEVYCGPVGSGDDEARFDQVPIVFEDDEDGQIAQPVVDAVNSDVVLPNALILIGPDGPVDSD